RRQSVLCFDDEFVLTRLVAEVRNKFAVRRPCGIAFSRTTRVSQVADVAFVGWDREDLAARLDCDAFAWRRQSHVRKSIRNVFPVWHNPRKVAGRDDVDYARLATLRIEFVYLARLFEQDCDSAR